MEPDSTGPIGKNVRSSLLGNHQIQIALAVGISILVMAWCSKHALPRPIGYLPGAFPPFLAALYEVARNRYPERPVAKTGYWVVAILAATAGVIAAHAR